MTTIATDGKSMAGDGQAECQGTIVATPRAKVIRLADGSLFGSSGRSLDGERVARWLDEGGEKPKVDKHWTALRLHPNGELDYLTNEIEPVAIDLPAATGSGMDFALGAMEAGADPAQAVAIAARRDTATGGIIVHLMLAGDA